GPVVVSLPEDMLTDRVEAPDARPYAVLETTPQRSDLEAAQAALVAARNPLVVLGGSRWDAEAVMLMTQVATRLSLPIAVSFRRQSLFPADHPNFVGELGVGSDPRLIEYARESDLVLLLGGRLSELPSQGYS